MKHLNLIVILLFTLLSCSSYSSTSKQTTSTETQSTDEIIRITNNKNFDITFKDSGFNSWLLKQDPKKNFYESSLEILNTQYVNEWNNRADNPSMYDSTLYSQRIEYQIKTNQHYGLDVNYKLYMYFKFFEHKHEKILK